MIINEINYSETIELKEGDKVHYTSPHGSAVENGIIKSLSENNMIAWVVYACGGDWDNYKDYTGASTNIKDLTLGWVEE